MKRFLLLGPVLIGLFFILFYLDISPLARLLNELQTGLTLRILEPTLGSSVLRENIVYTPVDFRIIINKACNGMAVVLIYLGLIWAYPRGIIDKMVWSGIGYIILTLVNILRLYLVTLAVEHDRESFEIAHDFFGNVLLILIVLLLFVAFIKISKRKKRRVFN